MYQPICFNSSGARHRHGQPYRGRHSHERHLVPRADIYTYTHIHIHIYTCINRFASILQVQDIGTANRTVGATAMNATSSRYIYIHVYMYTYIYIYCVCVCVLTRQVQDIGTANRTVGATAMNATSSRAHTYTHIHIYIYIYIHVSTDVLQFFRCKTSARLIALWAPRP